MNGNTIHNAYQTDFCSYLCFFSSSIFASFTTHAGSCFSSSFCSESFMMKFGLNHYSSTDVKFDTVTSKVRISWQGITVRLSFVLNSRLSHTQWLSLSHLRAVKRPTSLC